MARVVGAKGQVVIEKEIRDRLGVQPGWLAFQLLVDNHVEVHFLPREHNRSLKGSLSRYGVGVSIKTDEDWDRAREFAWAQAAHEKVRGWDEGA